MTTPRKIEVKAKEMRSIMNAFENTYIECFELQDEIELRKREDAMYCFYHMKEVLEELISDMEELVGHMDVCNAIVAASKNRKEEN